MLNWNMHMLKLILTYLVLAFTLICASTASATGNGNSNSNNGKDSTTNVETDVNNENTNRNETDVTVFQSTAAGAVSQAKSGAVSEAGAVAVSGQEQKAKTGDQVLTFTDIEVNPAQSAPSSIAQSASNVPGCGDTTGLGAQTQLAGGSAATISESCRAVRYAQATQALEQNGFTKRAKVVTAVYWIGLPFRTVIHVVSGGILN